jgi:hypothetical protein
VTPFAAYRSLLLSVLTLQAWIELLRFDLSRSGGFARVCASVGRTRAARRRPLVAPTDVIWAVDEACVWYVKRAACLQRSIAATRLLRRYGFAAEMVIGCRPLPFESHAWVELDGRVVNDLPQYPRAFTVLSRL